MTPSTKTEDHILSPDGSKKIDKVSRYGWKLTDATGVMQWISALNNQVEDEDSFEEVGA